MRTAAPIKNNISANSGSALRYGMFIPLAFMIASVITSCFSYSTASFRGYLIFIYWAFRLRRRAIVFRLFFALLSLCFGG